MRVRAVRPEEWERLRGLRLRALAEDPAAFGARWEEERELPTDEWRRRFLDGPDRVMLVAERDDAWIGLCGVQPPHDAEERTDPQIFSMWVAPEARGAGAARALVDAALAWARERGATHVCLWVNVAQDPARRLYERMGFEPVGEIVRGTRDPSRRFQRMRRAL